MISFEEAVRIAEKAGEDFNKCFEREKAYLFWNSANDHSFGPVPLAIAKEDGRAYWYSADKREADAAGKEIRTIDL